MQWKITFLCPFRQALGQQGQTGHQKQHLFPPSSQNLSNFETGEGLACSTGHNEFAPVGICQSMLNGTQGKLLVIPQHFPRFEGNRGIRLVLGPVNGTVLQIRQVNPADGNQLSLNGIFGVVTPMQTGAENNPVGKDGFTRNRQKTVDVTLLEFVIFGIQFALDGVKLSRPAYFSHQVDSAVLTRSTLAMCPVLIHPGVLVQVPIFGFRL
ncbi:hypothetical protein FEMY_19990 [Ferrovum myxofaciens]|uniref:Uncharacterized protein n=1 Tax=Ferrovum myxofaciens TaxID=416213 RepID=A0A149VX30_9PROT|nr:hypothetical protein FEMY_19990 [Ferrovum myxofaciens]